MRARSPQPKSSGVILAQFGGGALLELRHFGCRLSPLCLVCSLLFYSFSVFESDSRFFCFFFVYLFFFLFLLLIYIFMILVIWLYFPSHGTSLRVAASKKKKCSCSSHLICSLHSALQVLSLMHFMAEQTRGLCPRRRCKKKKKKMENEYVRKIRHSAATSEEK